jgi:ABC-type glycerol-3-phosphate transport system substrate-binding protein
MKKTRMLCAMLIFSMLLALTACGETPSEPPAVSSADEPEVALRISGGETDCSAMEWAAVAFNQQYPNCTVIYENLQGDYNAVLNERAHSEGDDRVDLFITTTGIQADHALLDCACDLMSLEGLDLSHTFPSLLENAMLIEPDGSAASKIYCIPMGAQMRGMYANLSLLQSVGIQTEPTNQAELLKDCEILKQAGYIPMQGEPGTFPQQLLYPWICNNVANADDYEEAYRLVNTRDAAACDLFRDVYAFLYTLVKNDYYDYRTSKEKFGFLVDSANEDYARILLNIVETEEGSGEYQAGEGVGQAAFVVQALSLKPVVEQMKEDYHSNIEYTFIPAPVGVDGGYVYLSPANMIGVNRYSEKLDWAVKFLNFLFTPEYNAQFAEKYCVIPNTTDAFDYVSNLFDVPADHISELGQATFDWGFYRTMTRGTDELSALPAIAKANNPKYFDPETGAMYPFAHYWKQFQAEFTAVP